MRGLRSPRNNQRTAGMLALETEVTESHKLLRTLPRTHPTYLTEIVQRYNNRAETEAGPSNQVGESQPKTCLWELDKPCVDDLSVTDFVHLEKQFETALLQTRATKTNLLLESLSSLHGKEKLLEEENKMLQEKISVSKTKTPPAFDLNALPGGENE
ncbi:hypothetical protein SASPL_142880 [Salvia splendens]|uniref:K-box domain-containing protein n=1 Tax=Salvia splendens TaxID=180675 RepID=A0A8X8WLN3_SALSN|nr:hypothetical protein SASPL_142880 [Salvia splendens]